MTKDPQLSGPAPQTTIERYGPPWERHYDVTFATETNVATWDPLDETDLRIPKHRCHFWSNGVEVKEDWQGSSEKIIMDRAIGFVRDSAEKNTPFLATIWFYGPHSPTRAGKELRDLYPDLPLGRQHYLGSVTSIDREVGRLRQALEQCGEAENTLIFFCSDNGPEGTGDPPPEYDPYQGVYYGEAGEFKGRKRYLYNGGVCVPAFAWWPGVIDAGRTVHEPVCTLDYLPTLCELLAYQMPDDRPIDGVSTLPLLRGEAWAPNRFIPFASDLRRKQSPSASIINQEHKLLLWFDENKPDELYHLQNDASEQENLIRERKELANELRAKLTTWLKSARNSYERGDYPGYERQGRFIPTPGVNRRSAPFDAASDRPNILFVMSDDHTTQAIGVYASRLAELNPTPNIDALAKNGMRFDRVFCNNSICTPSRASIITGQYSQTNGVLDLNGNIPPSRQFLPMEMKKAGYQTAMIGKWHLKNEPAAFDYYCVLPGQGKYHDPDFRIRGGMPWPRNVITKKGQHSSDAITDISLEWLKNGRDKDKPFFLMHHFKAPHDMFSNAKRYDEYLASVEIPEPDNLFHPPASSVGSRDLGSGVGRTHSPWELAKRLDIPSNLNEREYAKASYQEYLKRYLRCVKGVDDNVKRIIDCLKETGDFENTIIIYTGDQGFFLGEHDLMDKRWMYEEAFRMPFIVHWPNGIQEGSNNDWLINNTDFAPTILELSGVQKTPDYMQGRSFASALRQAAKPDDWRKVTYYRYWMHMAHKLAVPAHFGVRSERYKLIFFYGSDFIKVSPERRAVGWGMKNNKDLNRYHENTSAAWEFYDLENDPSEMKNVYNDPQYGKVIHAMKVELEKVRAELNETDEKYPHIQTIIDANWN